MLDLHSHILPGFDDGAKDESAALTMLKLAVAGGTQGMVATPHVIGGAWLPRWEEVVASCELLAERARRAGVCIDIFPGAEVALQEDMLGLLAESGDYCINGGKYILVELPATTISPYTDEIFFALQVRGLFPVLAHPERHPELARKPEVLAEWIHKGIIVQLNGTSITGRMGERIRQFSEFLLLNGMVHCVASDAHGVLARRPGLVQAAARVCALVGAKTAEQVFVANPGKIIKGEDIIVQSPPEVFARKETSFARKWLDKLRMT